jgi:tetratricopeptide (TPR) repeat protein
VEQRIYKRHFSNRARDYAIKLRRRGGGDFSSTERLLTEGLCHYPGNVYLMVYLGNLYRGARRDAEATGVFRRAFLLHPKAQIAVMGFANFLALKKEYDQAEDVYAHMFSISGARDLRLMTALGNVYQSSNLAPLAAACFGKAVQLVNADDYARRRYKAICDIFPPGFVHEEWKNFLKRMADRKGTALEFHLRVEAVRQASQPPQKPKNQAGPAGRDVPFYSGPAWS